MRKEALNATGDLLARETIGSHISRLSAPVAKRASREAVSSPELEILLPLLATFNLDAVEGEIRWSL